MPWGSSGVICGGSISAFAADVDGDGASEIVCNNPSAGNNIEVRKWQGSTFGAPETWKKEAHATDGTATSPSAGWPAS